MWREQQSFDTDFQSLFVKCLGYTARKANIYITELVQSGKLILVDIIIITGNSLGVLEFTW